LHGDSRKSAKPIWVLSEEMFGDMIIGLFGEIDRFSRIE